jgi:hypothetical protein
MQVAQGEEQRKPVLLSRANSESVVDLFHSNFKCKRGKVPCNYCRNVIEDHWAFRKKRNSGGRYYHIQCAQKAGFEIRDISLEEARPVPKKEEARPILVESKDETHFEISCLLTKAILENDKFMKFFCSGHGWICELNWQQHVKAPAR